MRNFRYEGEGSLDTSAMVARVILEDTIKAAYRKGGGGRDMVNECLAVLNGEEGDTVTQAMIAEYIGDPTAAAAAGVEPGFDSRVLKNPQSVNALRLKEEMANQLEAYLSLSQSEQAAFRKGFQPKR